MHYRQNEDFVFNDSIYDPVRKCFYEIPPNVGSNASPRQRMALDLPKARLDSISEAASKPGVTSIVVKRSFPKFGTGFGVKDHA